MRCHSTEETVHFETLKLLSWPLKVLPAFLFFSCHAAASGCHWAPKRLGTGQAGQRALHE